MQRLEYDLEIALGHHSADPFALFGADCRRVGRQFHQGTVEVGHFVDNSKVDVGKMRLCLLAHRTHHPDRGAIRAEQRKAYKSAQP